MWLWRQRDSLYNRRRPVLLRIWLREVMPLIQRRRRYQQGSLQKRLHGRSKMWVLLYREGSSKRYRTLGSVSEMSKSEAQAERAKIMREVNEKSNLTSSAMTFGKFVEDIALPFLRPKWKLSTATTTENAIKNHLVSAFKDDLLSELSMTRLQAFLQGKADAGCSESIIAHCRWTLGSIMRLAKAEGRVNHDPTEGLYIPKCTPRPPAQVMKIEDVPIVLGALEFRERVIASLAIFTGLRPGEILAFQRKHVQLATSSLLIEQRVYAGVVDSPKTATSVRTVAVPPATALLLGQWMELVPDNPEAWVFASENPDSPLRLENLSTRCLKPALEKIGMGWVNFQVFRRTHASLGQDAGIDPKVAADQRGHGIGVSLNVYTRSAFHKKMDAAEQLEKAVLKA